MPAAFEKCVKEGGKVRTVSGPSKTPKLKKGEYIHVCIASDGGRYWGEVRKKVEKTISEETMEKVLPILTLEDIDSLILEDLTDSQLYSVHKSLHDLWNTKEDKVLNVEKLIDSHYLIMQEYDKKNLIHHSIDLLDGKIGE
jgi:hypothetical protein